MQGRLMFESPVSDGVPYTDGPIQLQHATAYTQKDCVNKESRHLLLLYGSVRRADNKTLLQVMSSQGCG